MALAIAAANQGLPVVLVERGRMGGANVGDGAVPTKALLAAAGLHDALRRGPAFGVTSRPQRPMPRASGSRRSGCR
ncbi:MAG: hypothetical protein J0H08_01860 [Rhizobiales bacterium]|nr:hypothetical protein [Hyphomicrobiales bacterium]